MSRYFEETMVIMEKIENKLDLMLELVQAKKDENWKLVDEIVKKLDAITIKNSS